MNENDKNLLSGIGDDVQPEDTVTEYDDALIAGLFARSDKAASSEDDGESVTFAPKITMVPREDTAASAPAPRANGAAAPQTNGAAAPRANGAAAPRATGTAAPRTNGAAAPRTNGAAAPRTNGATAPRTNGATAPRTNGTAAPRTNGAAAPRTNGAAAPRANPSIPRTDARYNMSPAEIRTLAAAAENAVANGRYGAALDSVFFTAGKARLALRDMINIRVPIGSRDEDLPGIAAAALITCYLQSETIDGDSILEQLRLIIESSEDENGACPSAEQVRLRVFECVLILCVQAEQSGKHPLLKDKLYRDENSFLCTYLSENFSDIMEEHGRAVESFFNSVKVQSTEVTEIFEGYLERTRTSPILRFAKDFFLPTKPVMITSIVFGVLFLISLILHFVNYGSLMSFIATDSFIMTLVVILEVLFCGALLGTAWLVSISGKDRDEE